MIKRSIKAAPVLVSIAARSESTHLQSRRSTLPEKLPRRRPIGWWSGPPVPTGQA